jgi:hypothetical protein
MRWKGWDVSRLGRVYPDPVAMDLQQVQEVGPVQQSDLLVSGEILGALAETGGRDEDTFAGTLVLHSAVEFADGGHRNRLPVPLSLDYGFPSFAGFMTTASTPSSRLARVT